MLISIDQDSSFDASHFLKELIWHEKPPEFEGREFSSNWYVLCSNDPVNKVDLIGLCEEHVEPVQGNPNPFTASDMLNLSQAAYNDSGDVGK